MAYRKRTNDYIIDGKVFDIYTITRRKIDVNKFKRTAKRKYKYVRVLKRKDGYYILVM